MSENQTSTVRETTALVLGLGVEQVVLCTGARNAPLARQLLAQTEIQIWHHFDERSAAFFALGISKMSQKPVAVITTSGTAVAELLPALIEAYYSGIPLIALTADRPTRFRGSGAPQAIEQEHIFGIYADRDPISWKKNGPLHINLPLEEPDPSFQPVSVSAALLQISANYCLSDDSGAFLSFLQKVEKGNLLVLLGEISASDRESIREFLLKLGAPIWAEAISGLREEESLSSLQIPDETEIPALTPSQVLRIGGVPSCRYWRDLETNEVEVFSITRLPFPGLSEKRKMGDLTLLSHRPNRVQSRPFSFPMQKFESGSELAAIRILSEQIPTEALVYLGNSLPIREWNRAATRDIPHPHCVANRGANGIDGQLSSFFGCVSESPLPEAWGIFGDLTSLYDLNAPWILHQLNTSALRIRIVIVNNGGGKIFSTLPALRTIPDPEKQITENHHRLRFHHWAAMWDLDYLEWDPKSENFPDLADKNRLVLELKLQS